MIELPPLALTLHQPWGSLIMLDHPQWKDVENRGWSPSARQLPPGGRFWIHGRMKLDEEVLAWALDSGFDLRRESIPRGALLGHVRFERATPVRTSQWHVSGQVGWYLADRVVLPKPIPCRGAQGLWSVPSDVLEIARVDLEGRAA